MFKSSIDDKFVSAKVLHEITQNQLYKQGIDQLNEMPPDKQEPFKKTLTAVKAGYFFSVEWGSAVQPDRITDFPNIRFN